MTRFFLVLFFLFSVNLFSQNNYLVGKIIKITDGDTVQVLSNNTKVKIRLLGIDAPETHYQGHSQGHWGDYATNYLNSIIPVGTSVRVYWDTEKFDKYGRLLGWIFKGSLDVNKQMLESGYAVMYQIYPNIGSFDIYSKATNYALTYRLGIFNANDPLEELPYVFRKTVDGNSMDKWVVDFYSCYMYEPENFENVRIENRLFFYNKNDAINFSKACQNRR